jgi:hypothetical protein
MLVPPAITQPTPVQAIAVPQQLMKQPRGAEQVRTQTRNAVDAPERGERGYRLGHRRDHRGGQVDIFV